jgi:Icc-related predicted phosphoesterase
MMQAVAVTDLHGNISLYELLFRVADLWKLTSIFITGDLAPSAIQGRLEGNEDRASDDQGMVVQKEFFTKQFIPLCSSFLLEHRHTDMYVIMGNDDRRANERLLEDFNDEAPNFHLVNDRLVALRDSHQKQTFFPGEVPRLWVAGYPYVPPGGSLLMDWVKYENRVKLRPIGMDSTTDIYEMGITTDAKGHGSTIAEDLEDFGTYLRKSGRTDEGISYDPAQTIHLFHAPPYNTPLDWTTPRGRYDYLPLSDHVGSVEIRRFIERVRPYLVLSGHCHESVVTGDYKVDLGRTRCVNPGSQTHLDVLSLVQFDLYHPQEMKQFFIHAR